MFKDRAKKTTEADVQGQRDRIKESHQVRNRKVFE